MVQDHQKPMRNPLAAANYNTRYALYDQKIIDKALKLNSSELRESTLRRIASAREKVVRYMLFTEEPPLPLPAGFEDAAFEISLQLPDLQRFL